MSKPNKTLTVIMLLRHQQHLDTHRVSFAAGDEVATVYMVTTGSKKDEEFRIQLSLEHLFWKHHGQGLRSTFVSFAYNICVCVCVGGDFKKKI